jgi:hypothetical protein
VGST